MNHYADKGFESLRYKAVPYIYRQAPSSDDLYALFRLGAVRYRCDLSCAIDLANPWNASHRRARALKKAWKSGVEVARGSGFAGELWKLLEENLARKYRTVPAHSLNEILTLYSSFPTNVEFIVALLDSRVVAGIVLFSTSQVAHVQYAASSTKGYATCALDAVLKHCITEAQARSMRYFDFGISNEKEGHYLNEPLYQFKAEFGGGGVVHEFYEIKLRS
jgi:lipid II:glycine glycyltransferase (peptidoglycan interpeptide bridge formation enzyme)